MVMKKSAAASKGNPAKKTRHLPPQHAAEQMLERLRANADQQRAASNQRYFKEPVACFGIDSPMGKALRKELVERIRGSWTLREAVLFCRAMVRDPHLESRGIGFQMVAEFVSEAGPELLPQLRRWLEHSCGNWALVDNLAPSVVAPLPVITGGAPGAGTIGARPGGADSDHPWVHVAAGPQGRTVPREDGARGGRGGVCPLTEIRGVAVGSPTGKTGRIGIRGRVQRLRGPRPQGLLTPLLRWMAAFRSCSFLLCASTGAASTSRAT